MRGQTWGLTGRDEQLTRMRQHFEDIARLPPYVRYMDDPNVRFTWSGSAYILACDLKHAGKGQLMREEARDVLVKHACVHPKGQYLKILCDFQELMYAHEEWCRENGFYSITDIGIQLWLSPVLRRWRLVREAATLCGEAARRERWWLAFAEHAFRPAAAAVHAAAAEFAALSMPR